MNLKAALLATATAGALLIAACGGDGGQSQLGSASDSAQSQPASGGDPSGIGNAGGNGGGGGSGSASGTRCGSAISGGSGSSSGTSAKYVAIDLRSGGYGFGIAEGEQVGSGAYEDSSQSRPVSHALLWRGSASSAVDLHPNGFIDSKAVATSGGMQAGSGYTSSGAQHALKWAGSASSVVDLDPTGLRSEALGICGDQVVGFSQMPHVPGVQGVHAFLWTGGSVVDLHPNGFGSSVATATDGAQQVGGGRIIGGDNHALLWTGTAASVVDLHAVGYSYSRAWGVGSGQQVGDGDGHALLWTGTAQSVVDLHPSGFRATVATAVAAGRQVGYGTTVDGSTRALLWNGAADSVVDLHMFLPPGFSASQAQGIDASGNVIGIATAQACSTSCAHAILWIRQ